MKGHNGHFGPSGTLTEGKGDADPGPICYGNGGTEPTVTDAHVVLGRIPPHLLGGEIPLSVDAARKGLTALGMEPGTAPPMSSWWPKAWMKATTSGWPVAGDAANTGTVTHRSGRCPMPPSDRYTSLWK